MDPGALQNEKRRNEKRREEKRKDEKRVEKREGGGKRVDDVVHTKRDVCMYANTERRTNETKSICMIHAREESLEGGGGFGRVLM